MFKKLLLLLTIALPMWATLPAGTVFEVRGASGSDTNAGCFVTAGSGTDETYPTPTVISFTDLVAASGTTITSVAHPFDTTSPGNCLRISSGSGWTTGLYYIVSQSGGTATVDRTIATGGSTGGTGKLGGALATIAQAQTDHVVSNHMYVKADGTYTVTTALNINGGASTANSTTILEGYTSTRGDNGKVTLTTATNSVRIFSMTASPLGNTTNWMIKNFSISNTASSRDNCFHAQSQPSTDFYIENVVMDGCNIGIDGDWTVDYTFTHLFLNHVEIKNSVSDGIRNTGVFHIANSYIHDNGGMGIQVSGSYGEPTAYTLTNTIISTNTSNGFYDPRADGAGTSYHPVLLLNNAIYNNGGDGIKLGSSANVTQFVAQNNIIYGNTGWGWNIINIVNSPIILNNAFGSNGSGNYTGIVAGEGEVALSANPFTSSSDFSPNSTAGGGALTKAGGFPGTIFGGIGYLDIGPLQHMDSGGGGSAGGSSVVAQ